MRLNKLKLSVLTIALSFVYSGQAQSEAQRKQIIKHTNVEELNALGNLFNKEYLEREQRISAYLRANPNKERVTKDGFKIQEIYDVLEDGTIWYYSTSNYNSARTLRADRLYNGGSLDINIQGQGMTAGVWDAGSVRSTHVEFPNNKITLMNSSSPFDDHATHVAGTITAKGITIDLRGIAFDSSVKSYDWTNDYTEMANESGNGLLVSNHSYWIGPGLFKWILGAYDSRAAQFDEIAFYAPYYLAVTAAGNDRNDFSNSVIGPYLNEKGGYNLTRGMQNAKNYLTVGAVYQVLNYNSPSSVIMSDFSSWGPTDDGRIKPEVVAKGVSVKSPTATSNTAFASLPGTSMASPSIAGAALLLQQYYSELNGTPSAPFMRAASLKGLMIHSANEAGSFPGPDYMFGFGLVNLEKAAQIVKGKSEATSFIDEKVLNNETTYSQYVTAVGSEPLQVSISWTDRPAAPNNNQNDPTTLYLINDLDVRVFKDGVEYFPWTLDPAVPYNPAVNTADNFRDNYERIDIANPNGTYEIVVSHKGSLVGNMQDYSLIISGPNLNASVKSMDEEFGIRIFPNPTQGVLNFETADSISLDKVEIYDTIGKRVFSSAVYNNSIDISALTSGVYFVKAFSGERQITKKIVKN